MADPSFVEEMINKFYNYFLINAIMLFAAVDEACPPADKIFFNAE